MIQFFPWNMESISRQFSQYDFLPFSLIEACAAASSAKRSGRRVRWYEGCTMLENQHIVAMQRASSTGSAGGNLLSGKFLARWGRIAVSSTSTLTSTLG